jgi:hypothetical protein
MLIYYIYKKEKNRKKKKTGPNKETLRGLILG